MSDSEAERLRKVKAGREKLLQYQQKKRKKKKEEASKHSQKSNGDLKSHSKKSNTDVDTDQDVSSIASSVGQPSHRGSPTPNEGDQQSYASGSENHSYASGSDYTSGDESFFSSIEDGGGVDSLAIANLEVNEFRQRVLELEEILRGKQAAMKELNKENFELKTKVSTFQSAERQGQSPSPVLHQEIEELQQTVYAKQRALDDINRENQDLRVKLSSTRSNSKSESSQLEELKGKLKSKQTTLEMLSQQNEQLLKENKDLKDQSNDRSFGSDTSQIESLQGNLKTKQMMLIELNKQNQELREKVSALSRDGLNSKVQEYEQKINDLKSELELNGNELERLKANEVTLIQTRELLRDSSNQLSASRAEFVKLQESHKLQSENSWQQQEALKNEIVEKDNNIAKLKNLYNTLNAGSEESFVKLETSDANVTALSKELSEKNNKIKELEDQLSLAIGERDAVQLEANTQIEDFEEEIKLLQERLQKNDSTTKENDQKVDKASEEVTKSKKAVMELQDSITMKENEIKSLLSRLETVQLSKNNELKEVRDMHTEETNDLRKEIASKDVQMNNVISKLNIVQEEYQNSKTVSAEKVSLLERLLEQRENEFSKEYEKLEENYQNMLQSQEDQYYLQFEAEKEKWENEMSEKLLEVRTDQNRELQEIKEKLNSEMNNEKDKNTQEQLVAQEQIYKTLVNNLQNELTISRKESETHNDKNNELNVKLTDKVNGIKVMHESMVDKDNKIKELAKIITEKDNELELVVGKLGNYEKDSQELVDKHSAQLHNFETQIMNLTNLLDQEKVNVDELLHENEKLKADKSFDENAIVNQLTNEKDFLRREVENLRKGITQKDTEVEQLKQDITGKDNDIDRLRQEKNQFEIQKSNELHSMKNTLRANNLKAQDNMQTLLENEKRKTLIEFQDLRNEIDAYEQIVTEKDIELEHLHSELLVKCKEIDKNYEQFDVKVKDFEEEKDILVQQHNETVSNLKESVRNLKEEIVHVKDKNDKQMDQLQADFEIKFVNKNEEFDVKLKDFEEEKGILVQQHNDDISMLKESVTHMFDQHKAETDDSYSDNVMKLQDEHLEQVQSLKEEIAHIKDTNDKQMDKLQADFEYDVKQLDDENHNLKAILAEMQQKLDVGLSARDDIAQHDIQRLQEIHEADISKMKEDLAQLENDSEKAKEKFASDLKKLEDDRQKEIVLLIDKAEQSKRVEIENIKEEAEKAKQQEIDDVVCSLTQERRENIEEIKEELEKQLSSVRMERDEELTVIQEQNRIEKDDKIAEMEEMLGNQIAKYQAELGILQNKLAKSEEQVYNLTVEKEDMSMTLMESKAFVEENESNLKHLESQLSAEQKNNNSLQEEMSKLQDTDDEFKKKMIEEGIEKEELRECVAKLTEENDRYQQYWTDMNEKEAKMKWRREILGNSFKEVLHDLTPQSEALLEQSLNSCDDDFSFENNIKELTAISKQQILELLQKMREISDNADDVNKDFNETSSLNNLLKDEISRLGNELVDTKQMHNQVVDERKNLEDMVKMLRGERDAIQTEKDELETSWHQEQMNLNSTLNKVVTPEPQLLINIPDEYETDSGADSGASQQVNELNNELEQLKKSNAELEDSLEKVTNEKETLERIILRENTIELPVIILEDVDAEPVTSEEIIVPQSIEPVAMERQDTFLLETEAPVQETSVKELMNEIKHLESLLIESNNNKEKVKDDVKYLKEELEHERQIFAEQLELRQAKERELTENRDEFAKQLSAADRKDYRDNMTILLEKLKDKEKKEHALRDENYRLVNLVKENNLELYNEKESLQEQILKQEEVIQELQEKILTSDVVTKEIQDAFGRQLAALHQQRTSLMEQLDQHKRDHQGFAKVVQEKADLEENLRNEKELLAEKLRQKDLLEKELDAEKSALREKLAELDKLREVLNEKNKFETELIQQKNELEFELERIDSNLISKEEALSLGREELQKELEMKDLELQNLEREINDRVTELGLREEKMKQQFIDTLESTRLDLERTNDDNLATLRNDLDEDYRGRLSTLEDGLHEEYGQQLTRMRENYDEQLQDWFELCDWLLGSVLELPCFKMARVKTDFEEKLRDLRRQLEEERLRQVGTIKNVLEREHRQELVDMQFGHDNDIDAIKSALKEDYNKELEEVTLSLEKLQQDALEKLKASLKAESQASIDEEKLRTQTEFENKEHQLKEELRLSLIEELTNVEQQHQQELQRTKDIYTQEANERMEEKLQELEEKHSREVDSLLEDSSNKSQLKIRELEQQFDETHHQQLQQTQQELHSKYNSEMETLKTELLEKHGQEMYKAVNDFQVEQETYFKERLIQMEGNHQVEVEKLREEYEILLKNSKADSDELKERMLIENHDLIKQIDDKETELSNVEEEYKKETVKREENFNKRIDVIKDSLAKEKELWKLENQGDIQEVIGSFERTLTRKECELEERVQELKSNYEAEMLKKDMDYVKGVEDLKLEFEKREAEIEQNHLDEVLEIEENSVRYMEELKIKHREELEDAVTQLASNLKEDFDRIIKELSKEHDKEKDDIQREALEDQERAVDSLRIEKEQAIDGLCIEQERAVDSLRIEKEQAIDGLCIEQEKALDNLRIELNSDYNQKLDKRTAKWELATMNKVASINTTLAMKHAQESEKLRAKLTRKYEKEMDAMRYEMQDDFSKNALRQAEQLEAMEIKHRNDIRNIKQDLEEKHKRLLNELQEKNESGFGESVTSPEAVSVPAIVPIVLDKVEMGVGDLTQYQMPNETMKPLFASPFVEKFAENQAESILGAVISDVSHDISLGDFSLMEQTGFGTEMFRDSDFNLVAKRRRTLRLDDQERGREIHSANLGTDEECASGQELMVEDIEKRLREYELESQKSRDKLKEDLDNQYRMQIEQFTKEKEVEMENLKMEMEEKQNDVLQEKMKEMETELTDVKSALEEKYKDQFTKEKDAEMENLKMEMEEKQNDLLQEKMKEKETELTNVISALEEKYKDELESALYEKENEMQAEMQAEIEEKFQTELIEKVKEKEDEAMTDRLALMEQHQKLLDEFVHEQEKQLNEMKQEHEQELEKLKVLLTTEYDEHISEFENKQEDVLQLLTENYELKLRQEREDYEKQREEDVRKLKESLDEDAVQKHDAIIEILKEQHRRDLKLLQDELLSRQEDDIENLRRHHEDELERVKEGVRSDMTDDLSMEMERVREVTREVTRNECEQEHFDNLKQLEEELERKHVKQLESLAEMQQRHVKDIETMKNKHESQVDNIKDECARKIDEEINKHVEEIDAVNIDLEKEIEKIKMELETAHRQEIEKNKMELETAHRQEIEKNKMELETAHRQEIEKNKMELETAHTQELEMKTTELTNTNAKLLSLEAMNSGMDSTYEETVAKLQEDYENQISNLKLTLEEVRRTQVAKLEHAFNERQEAENQMVRQNFEKELDYLRQEHEESLKETKIEFEKNKQRSLEEIKARYEKQLIELEERFENEKTEMGLKINDISDGFSKESDWFKDENEKLVLQLKQINEISKELGEENRVLKGQVQEMDDRLAQVLSRHEREEQESDNLIKMLRSDSTRIAQERNDLRRANEHLLQVVSDSVRAVMLTEDMINRHLDDLILENSATESGVGGEPESGGRGEPSLSTLARSIRRPDGANSFRLGNEETPRSGLPLPFSRRGGQSGMDDTEMPEQTTLRSDGSLLSDEGLELSTTHGESMFQGPDLDGESEDIVKGTSERLRTAVEHLLKMLSMTTRQAADTKRSYEELLENTSDREAQTQNVLSMHEQLVGKYEKEQQQREQLERVLQEADQNLQEEHEKRNNLEMKLSSREVDVESIREEVEDLRHKLKNATESGNADIALEERCNELQAEKNLLAKVKTELEMKIAELKTGIENERFTLKRENDQLKGQLAKTGDISADDMQQALEEIEELRHIVLTVNEEKELLKSHVMNAKDSSVADENEVITLKENISQMLNVNQHISEENELLKGKYAALEAAIEESLEQHKEEVTQLLTSNDKLTQENEELKKEQEENEELKKEQEQKEQEITESLTNNKQQEMTRALNYAKEQNNALQDEISNLQDVIEHLNEKISQENETLKEQELEKLELTEALASEEENKNVLRNEVKHLEDVVETLKQNTDHISMELEDKTETELVLLNKISEMEESVSKIQFSNQNKLHLEKQMKDFENDHAQLLETLEENHSECEQLKKDVKQKNKQIADLQKSLDETRALLSDSKIMKIEVEKMKGTLSSKEGQYTSLARETELVRQLLEEKVQELEHLVNEQQDEIYTLSKLMETKNTELLRKEQGHQDHLNKIQRGFEQQVEEAVQMTHDKITDQYRIKLEQIQVEHKAEIDRVLEVSRLDAGDLGQQLQEALGATERLDRQMLEHLLRQNQLNETRTTNQSTHAPGGNTTIQTLLNDLQTEAESIANLVVSYPIVDHGLSLSNILELQRSWSYEKQALLETVKALKDLVVKASQTAMLDTTRSDEDWRNNLILAVHEVFDRERQVIRAEIGTLQNLVDNKQASPALLHDAKRQVAKQEELMNRAVGSLQSKDRESLVIEIRHLQQSLQDLQQHIKQEEEEYKRIVKDNQITFERRENHLNRQLVSQTNLAEQERTSATQLRNQLEEELSRNTDLNKVFENEKKMFDDLKDSARRDQENYNHLVTALDTERLELKNIRFKLDAGRTESESLQRQEVEQQRRNAALNECLQNERKRIQELISERKRLLEVAEADKLTISQLLTGRDDVKEEVSSLSKALQKEEAERLRLENIAERYQTNLEELRKLYLSEKEQRVENERSLVELKQLRAEVTEKGQVDALQKESLRKELDNTRKEKSEIQHALERAQMRLTSYEAELKSDMTMRSAVAVNDRKIQNLSTALAEEKQSVEKLKEIVENTRINASEDVEKEKFTSKQLREALNNLQLKFENARRQLEIVRQQHAESEASHGRLAEKEQALKGYETTLKNKQEEVEKRETELTQIPKASIKVLESFGQRHQHLIVQHQDLVARERQNIRFGNPSPIVHQVQDQQFIQGALADLLQELKEVNKNFEGSSEGVNLSPTASPVLTSVLKKNDDLRDRIHKLNDEKSEFRTTLTALEEQIMQYRKREAELEEAAKAAESQIEVIVTAERSKWADDRASMLKSLESAMQQNAKQRIEIANKGGQPHPISKDDLAEAGWTLPKVQKLYGKYLRAESFKKALVYQKKYLLFLVGGFQNTEALTLSMIAKLGSGPDSYEPQYRISRGMMRFRAAARVVIAIWRMKYLVKKWNKGIMRVGEKHYRSKRDSNKKSPTVTDSGENSPEKESSNAKFSSRIARDSNVKLMAGQHGNFPDSRDDKYGENYRIQSKDIRVQPEKDRLSVHDLSKPRSSDSSSTDTDIKPNHVRSKKCRSNLFKEHADRGRSTIIEPNPRTEGKPTIHGHNKLAINGHDRYELEGHDSHTQPPTNDYPLKRRVDKLGTDVNHRLSERPNYSGHTQKQQQQSPPRAYPRPLSPKIDRSSPPVRDGDGLTTRQYGRSPSPLSRSSERRSNSPSMKSQIPSMNRSVSPEDHGASNSSSKKSHVTIRKRSMSPVNHRSSSSSSVDEANSSLNAYIKKLESLQARLRNSDRDSDSTVARNTGYF